MDQEKDKVTIVKAVDTSDKDKKDKKVTLLVILISSGFIFTVCLIVAAILLSLYFRNKGNTSSSEPEYHVTEETINRYNNLLSYINKERTSVDKSTATEIVSLSFKSKDLCVSYRNSKEPGFIRIETSYTTADECLNAFKDQSPKAGTYATEIKVMEFSSSPMGVERPFITGFVGTYMDNDYLSCTYENDNLSLSSITMALNTDIFIEPEEITLEKDQILYDMYHYILFLR